MKQLVIFICLVCTLTSCGHRDTCVNTNPILNQYSPNDKQYKVELLRQLSLRDPARVHYWVEKYVEIAKKPFMNISIESDSLCAKATLDIKNENKLQEYKTVKGLSYSGAEITGLQFAIDSTYGNYNFIFEEGTLVK